RWRAARGGLAGGGARWTRDRCRWAARRSAPPDIRSGSIDRGFPVRSSPPPLLFRWRPTPRPRARERDELHASAHLHPENPEPWVSVPPTPVPRGLPRTA